MYVYICKYLFTRRPPTCVSYRVPLLVFGRKKLCLPSALCRRLRVDFGLFDF